MLNGCQYCVNHHFTGVKRLIKDDARSAEIHAELSFGKWGDVFDSKEIAALEHVRKLTETPAKISPPPRFRLAIFKRCAMPVGMMERFSRSTNSHRTSTTPIAP